jgi:hypothetical protein
MSITDGEYRTYLDCHIIGLQGEKAYVPAAPDGDAQAEKEGLRLAFLTAVGLQHGKSGSFPMKRSRIEELLNEHLA